MESISNTPNYMAGNSALYSPTIHKGNAQNNYDVLDVDEKNRISIQRSLTRNQDIDVLRNILTNKKGINVLDIGCNNGDLIVDRLSEMGSICQVIGIDINGQIINEAKINHRNGKFSFWCLDSESVGFEEEILKIMDQKKVRKFGLVIISMVLLHLKDPYNLLTRLREFMDDSAFIFIREIDDGVSIAYPDPSGIVVKMLEISNYCEGTGCRQCGRQIYALLKNAGFRNIIIHNESINTMNKSQDERKALLNTNFSFIPKELLIMSQNYPSQVEYYEDYKWIIGAYGELEKLFQSEDFFYQMGTLVFTAQK